MVGSYAIKDMVSVKAFEILSLLFSAVMGYVVEDLVDI